MYSLGTKKKNIKKIANNIYDVCFNADRYITGHTETDAALWAKTNAVRHAHTIRAILDYAYQGNKKTLKILNASGLGCGHQDFSIVSFLRNNTNIKLDWTAFDSPNSEFLTHDLFRKYIKNLKIKLEFSDFSKTDAPYGKEEEEYDIIIFTEIAEHLDHSILLKLFAEIRNKMKEDGILIVTTPNLVNLKNRIRILIGNGDGPYWDDTPKTTKYRKGLYGHIVIYDIKRLRRLMEDVGYRVKSAYTFTYGRGPKEKFLTKRLLYKFIDLMSIFLKNSRTTLFIVATKA